MTDSGEDGEVDVEKAVQDLQQRVMALEHKLQELHEFVKPDTREEARPFHKSKADGLTPPKRTLAKAIVIECRKGADDLASIETLKDRLGTEIGFSRTVVRDKVHGWVADGYLEEPEDGRVRFADGSLVTLNEDLDRPVDWGQIDPSGELL